LRRPDAGLLTPCVEVAFPFSRDIALVMGWRERNTIRFHPAHEQAVEQVNRRRSSD
jgi:hypothetical protein